MKIVKIEKIWLVLVAFFYIVYNIPGVPPMEDAAATIIHALLTILPIWLVIYVGMTRVYKFYKLKDN